MHEVLFVQILHLFPWVRCSSYWCLSFIGFLLIFLFCFWHLPLLCTVPLWPVVNTHLWVGPVFATTVGSVVGKVTSSLGMSRRRPKSLTWLCYLKYFLNKALKSHFPSLPCFHHTVKDSSDKGFWLPFHFKWTPWWSWTPWGKKILCLYALLVRLCLLSPGRPFITGFYL